MQIIPVNRVFVNSTKYCVTKILLLHTTFPGWIDRGDELSKEVVQLVTLDEPVAIGVIVLPHLIRDTHSYCVSHHYHHYC